MEAQAIRERAVQADATRLSFTTACLGVAYAGSGQRDKALKMIAMVKAEAKGFLNRLKIDRFMDPLRNDPRSTRS